MNDSARLMSRSGFAAAPMRPGRSSALERHKPAHAPAAWLFWACCSRSCRRRTASTTRSRCRAPPQRPRPRQLRRADRGQLGGAGRYRHRGLARAGRDPLAPVHPRRSAAARRRDRDGVGWRDHAGRGRRSADHRPSGQADRAARAAGTGPAPASRARPHPGADRVRARPGTCGSIRRCSAWASRARPSKSRSIPSRTACSCTRASGGDDAGRQPTPWSSARAKGCASRPLRAATPTRFSAPAPATPAGATDGPAWRLPAAEMNVPAGPDAIGSHRVRPRRSATRSDPAGARAQSDAAGARAQRDRTRDRAERTARPSQRDRQGVRLAG